MLDPTTSRPPLDAAERLAHRPADLDPFLAEAAAIVDLPQPRPAPDLPFEQAEARFRQFSWRWSAPTRFGEKFRDELAASGRVPLGINANLVDIRLSTTTSAVSARFRSYAAEDPGFTVQARVYALCMGGHREPARAAQLPQPASERHRQRARPRRPLLLRPADGRHRRPAPRPVGRRRTDLLRADSGVRRGAPLCQLLARRSSRARCMPSTSTMRSRRPRAA